MSLKFKLILVRHADYDGNGVDPEVSEQGIQQAKKLAGKIKQEIVDSNAVVIWTSAALRAQGTTQAMKEELQLVNEVKVLEKLWSDNKHKEDYHWLLNELQSLELDGTLIIVSHLEYVRVFPIYLGFTRNEAGYTEGVVVDKDIIRRISYH
jgi:phosphohistidine phosphatase SixA